MKAKRYVKNIPPAPHESDSAGKITIPITYPDRRSAKTQAAIPSEENVIREKEWVDHNIK